MLNTHIMSGLSENYFDSIVKKNSTRTGGIFSCTSVKRIDIAR